MFCKLLSFRLLVGAFLAGVHLFLFLNTATAQIVWADTVLAETLIQESRQLNRQDKHKDALAKAQQALDIHTHLYGEGHVKTARSRMYVAREYRHFNREQEAASLFAQSLQVYEMARDTFQIALCHHNLGLCLRNQRRYAEAMQHAKQAIRLMRRDSIAQASFLADVNVNVGSILNAEKKYLAAIPVLEASKAVYLLKMNARSLGEVSYHLGSAYFGLHDVVRAKEHYLVALANLKNQLPPSHSYFADLYVKIGLCCQQTGESETGLAHLLEAKAAYLKAGTEDLNYIQFLQDLGQFYLDERQYPPAIEHLELCLSAKEKQNGVQSYHLLGTLQVLGEAYLQAGRFDQAEAVYRRLLRIAADSTGGQYKLAYRFYGKLAELRFLQGDFTGSLEHCDTAFAVAGFDPKHPEDVLPRDYFRELCQLYARSLSERFRQTSDTALLFRAERFFALAAETLYREVAEITVNSSREIFYDRDYPVLEQWLEARMRLFAITGNAEHAEAAFQIAGQSKAFLLSEAMRRSGVFRYAGVPDSIVRSELSLREKIVSAEKTLQAPGHQSSAQADSASLALNRELSHWRKDYDALLRRIENRYPEYFRLRLLQHDTPIGKLRQTWLAPDQALLMYSLTQSNIYTFVLTRDTFYVKTNPLDFSLNADIEHFRKCLTEYFTAADPNDALYDLQLEEYIALSQSLYRKLVLPVAPLLPERVVIIPESTLYYLPFEALLSGAPADAGNFRTYPFWAREKAISYALSTDFLAATVAPTALNPEKNWLGLAPFAANAQNGGVVSRATPNEKFSPLPFSGKEVNEIAALLHGEVWLGAEAWPGRFQSEASRFRILHLATHSRADDRLGDYSYLAASNSGASLLAKDLYQFSIAAEMVVLSACETGSGKLLRGEGIIGLVRAFTYAGARSTVASMWVANDQSTANLMVDFYRDLRKGMPKDVALKSARINLLNQAPAEAHPFFWAGFRVYGSVAPVF